jgi:cob(I)alamin adenosyltransferase
MLFARIAARYVGTIAISSAKLPKAEHTAPAWQRAMEALMLFATLGGLTMFARIDVVRALNRHVERVFQP